MIETWQEKCSRCPHGHWTRPKDIKACRDAREAAGVSQREAGRMFGRSGQFVHDVESGRRKGPEELLAVYLALEKRVMEAQ